MSDLLAGKKVLITGAGPNIGRSLALEMGAEGAEILFTEIVEPRLRSLEKELKARQVRCAGMLSDVTVEHDRDRLADLAQRDPAGIDVLVNNVGIDAPDALGRDGVEVLHEMERTFRINVFGPAALTERIAGEMIRRRRGGVILFVTSIHESIVRRAAAYSASKAALGMVVRELAVALAPHRIRVNGIAPGYVRTDDRGKMIRHRATPLYGTSIDPSAIGRAAVYLASEHFSRFTTGTILKIDAGLSLSNHLILRG